MTSLHENLVRNQHKNEKQMVKMHNGEGVKSRQQCNNERKIK